MNYTKVPNKFCEKNFSQNKDVADTLCLKLNHRENVVLLYRYNDWIQEGTIITTIGEFHKRNQDKMSIRYVKGQFVEYNLKDDPSILIINESFNESFEDFLSIEKRRILEYIISYRIENDLPIIILGAVKNDKVGAITQLSDRILNMLQIEMD